MILVFIPDAQNYMKAMAGLVFLVFYMWIQIALDPFINPQYT